MREVTLVPRVKRKTVHVFSAAEFALALSVCRYLKHSGVDAVMVTKHAVQIHPDHEQKAAGVLADYRWGWDRRQRQAREEENALL
jgi:hypothetical protein